MNPLQSIPVRGHLNDEQITECLMGVEPSGEISAHLMQCEICRQELERFGASIDSFNATTLAWGESRAGTSLLRGNALPRTDRHVFAVASWALATCLMLVSGLTFYMHRDPSAHVASAVASHEDSEAQIAQDNKLLTEVDLAIHDYGRSPVQEYGLLPNATDRSRQRGESRDQ